MEAASTEQDRVQYAPGQHAQLRADDPREVIARLTPTQRKVMQGVYCGMLNKQIAFDLGIAEATVKAHMTALMRKLNVRNRTQVAIAARTLVWANTDEADEVDETDMRASAHG